MVCTLCDGLAVVGAITLLVLALRVYRFVSVTYFSSVNIKERYAKVGSWAIVTGASDGIGRSLAIDIARRGMNVVLISRTKSKLDEVAAEIAKRYATVKTHVIPFDFSTATASSYAELKKQLAAFETGLLVNNVGVNYTYGMPFDSVPAEEDARLIRVNCDAQAWMTKIVLTHMKEKRGGGIVNLSSVAGTGAIPYLATYAATKAFNLKFSESLAVELAEFNIDVMAVTPNFVVSNMTQGPASRRPKESFLMVNSDTMARHTLSQLGSARVTSGHHNHSIVETIMAWTPRQFLEGHILKTQKKLFAKAQRQQQQQK